jgi:prolyl-tRNA synthetase
VHIITLSQKNDEITAVTKKIREELEMAGLEVLVDDRDERPGVKFKDSDLLGIPYRIVIGEKSLKDGQVEFVLRKTLEKVKLSPDECMYRIKSLFLEEMSRLQA